MSTTGTFREAQRGSSVSSEGENYLTVYNSISASWQHVHNSTDFFSSKDTYNATSLSWTALDRLLQGLLQTKVHRSGLNSGGFVIQGVSLYIVYTVYHILKQL